MHPVNFPQANVRFGPPEDYTEEQVRTIHAHRGTALGGSVDGDELVIVAWMPSKEDLAVLNEGNPIFLTCMGGLPPHFLTTSFEEASRPG